MNDRPHALRGISSVIKSSVAIMTSEILGSIHEDQHTRMSEMSSHASTAFCAQQYRVAPEHHPAKL